jgi:hypothetical protein
MLFFMALSMLVVATAGSVAMYQRGMQRRLQEGRPLPQQLLDAAMRDDVRGGKKALPAPERGDPTVDTLEPGDIVEEGSDDWIVEESHRYREERDSWHMHTINDGVRTRHLEVRTVRGTQTVAMLDKVDDAPRGQLQQGMHHKNTALDLEIRGDARINGDRAVKYARYTGAGGALLLVEDESGSRRAFFGHTVLASSLTLLSGELNREPS